MKKYICFLKKITNFSIFVETAGKSLIVKLNSSFGLFDEMLSTHTESDEEIRFFLSSIPT